MEKKMKEGRKTKKYIRKRRKMKYMKGKNKEIHKK